MLGQHWTNIICWSRKYFVKQEKQVCNLSYKNITHIIDNVCSVLYQNQLTIIYNTLSGWCWANILQTLFVDEDGSLLISRTMRQNIFLWFLTRNILFHFVSHASLIFPESTNLSIFQTYGKSFVESTKSVYFLVNSLISSSKLPKYI